MFYKAPCLAWFIVSPVWLLIPQPYSVNKHILLWLLDCPLSSNCVLTTNKITSINRQAKSSAIAAILWYFWAFVLVFLYNQSNFV